MLEVEPTGKTGQCGRMATASVRNVLDAETRHQAVGCVAQW